MEISTTKNQIVNDIIDVIKSLHLFRYKGKNNNISFVNNIIKKLTDIYKNIESTSFIKLETKYIYQYHYILFILYKHKSELENQFTYMTLLDDQNYKNMVEQLDDLCRQLGYSLYYNTIDVITKPDVYYSLQIHCELCDI
jgi:hypothetical protein